MWRRLRRLVRWSLCAMCDEAGGAVTTQTNPQRLRQPASQAIESLESRLLLSAATGGELQYSVHPTWPAGAGLSTEVHADYLEPLPTDDGQGAQAIATNDVIAPNFSAGGLKWFDTSMPVPYYVNTAGLPSGVSVSEYIAAVDSAVQAWQDVSGAFITFQKIGSGTAHSNTSNGDGVPTIGFGEAVPGALAHATTTFSGNQIVDYDVTLGTDRATWSTSPGGSAVDVWATTAHEVGHGLGLGHSEFTSATMYFAIFIGSTHQRDPDSDDSAGLTFLYPKGDMNGSGGVETGDVDAFILAFEDPGGYGSQHPGLDRILRGDITGNGQLNDADVAPYKTLLVNNGVPQSQANRLDTLLGHPPPPPPPPGPPPADFPYTERFNDGLAQALNEIKGTWSITAGRGYRGDAAVGNDAISVVELKGTLPRAFEISAIVRGKDPGGGLFTNAAVIFDYIGPKNFKFAGPFFGSDTWRIGKVSKGKWQTLASVERVVDINRDYHVKVLIDAGTATLVVDGLNLLSHTYNQTLKDGKVGVGTHSAAAVFDNLSVQPQGDVPAPAANLPFSERFNDGEADALEAISGTWTVNGGLRYRGDAVAGEHAVSLVALADPLPDRFQIAAIIRGKDPGGDLFTNGVVIFDYEGPSRFKFAGPFFGGGAWRIGKVSGGQSQTLASFDQAIEVEIDYDVQVLIDDSTATLVVNGESLIGHTFEQPLKDGRVGVGTNSAVAVFDDLNVRKSILLPYVENFNDGSAPVLNTLAGDWWINPAGRLRVNPQANSRARAVFEIDQPLPDQVEFAAVLRGKDPGGLFTNAVLIFDYVSSSQFRFAGPFFGPSQWRIGHFDAGAWVVDARVGDELAVETDYDVTLSLSGAAATLSMGGIEKLSHTFADGLNGGQFGLGTDNATAAFDDVSIRPGDPPATLPYNEAFNDGVANDFDVIKGTWSVNAAGRYRVVAGLNNDAIALVSLDGVLPDDVTIDVMLRGKDPGDGRYKNAVIIFDYQSSNNFKFIGGFFGNGGKWRVGHYMGGNWVTDAVVDDTLAVETDYNVSLNLSGNTAQLSVDGQIKLTHAFDEPLTDGRAGVGTNNASAAFDDFVIR